MRRKGLLEMLQLYPQRLMCMNVERCLRGAIES